MKRFLCLLLFSFLLAGTGTAIAGDKKANKIAQIKCDYKRLSKNEFELTMHLTLEKGWYVKANNEYDTLQHIKMPSFYFPKTKAFHAVGDVTAKGLIETKKLKHAGIVNLYSYSVLYTQKVFVAKPGTTVVGTYTYQLCNDKTAKKIKTDKFSVIIQ